MTSSYLICIIFNDFCSAVPLIYSQFQAEFLFCAVRIILVNNAVIICPGETPLHLAARYQRADATKKLLDAGADPTARDADGRTPLHAAVAADAHGVFQVARLYC